MGMPAGTGIRPAVAGNVYSAKTLRTTATAKAAVTPDITVPQAMSIKVIRRLYPFSTARFVKS